MGRSFIFERKTEGLKTMPFGCPFRQLGPKASDGGSQQMALGAFAALFNSSRADEGGGCFLGRPFLLSSAADPIGRAV